MLTDDGITLAQVDVDGKSNEITAFVPLLDRLPDLTKARYACSASPTSPKESAGQETTSHARSSSSVSRNENAVSPAVLLAADGHDEGQARRP
jgi:hypothetical protein